MVQNINLVNRNQLIYKRVLGEQVQLASSRLAAVGGKDWVRRERKGGSGGGLAVYSVNGVMLGRR